MSAAEVGQRLVTPTDTEPREHGPIRTFLVEAGNVATFSVRALRETPFVGRTAAEVFRQTALLVAGTTLLMVILMFTLGGVCGQVGNYFLRAIGASDYTGAFTALCSVRGAIPVMFGYVFAAKVGCGLVAEIGSMKISEELDAFRSVGIDPMRFVVATRLVAAWLFTPIIYAIAALATTAGAFFTVVVVIGEVPQGTLSSVHWALQSPLDHLFTFLLTFVLATTIVLVACYYGYHVIGGPAEVGAATAKSMILNLVLIHVIYSVMNLFFYGADPRLPIGGGG